MWKKILLGLIAVIIITVCLILYFTKTIADIADNQLEAIRTGNITKAYSYGSLDFQATTTLEDFQNFIVAYPSLKNNKSSNWTNREISNSNGTLTGTITANDGSVTPIEYHFIKENTKWKILGLQLHQTPAAITPVTATSPENKIADNSTVATTATTKIESSKKPTDVIKGEIFKILVSDTMNTKGEVETSKTIISTKSSKIYASVYILHAQKGLKITAELVNIVTGAKIGPSNVSIEKNGNVIRNFSFTNTAKIWPAGDYQINVTTSNQQYSTVAFKIQ